MKKFYSTALWAAAFVLIAGAADAATRVYTSPKYIFSTADVMCDVGVFGPACLDSANPMLDADFFKDTYTHYAIDSAYGFEVRDFDPSVAMFPRPMDGLFEEGYIADIVDGNGNVIGVDCKNDPTPGYLTGMLKGEVMAGVGGLDVKAGSEHYCVMDHVNNAPWMPPLVEVMKDPETGALLNLGDYTTRQKDDGKILYQWGNFKKRPTQLRLYKQIPLPDEWKVPGANYKVTKASLTITHRITTSPNDQIRPEDFENEWASGIKPGYTVDSAGRWLSDKDAFEGDGDFIPAGTVLRDPALIDLANGRSGDQWLGFTNAWYTSLDRDPFAGDNPRYRLKSSKFGQDIPGVEIPWYTQGAITTTTIDILAWNESDPLTYEPMNPPVPSPLSDTANWNNYLDLNPYDPADTVPDGLSWSEGAPLTPDFDLILFIKGEYSGTEVMDVQLNLEWEDPDYPLDDTPPPAAEIDTISVINAVYMSTTSVLQVKASSSAGELAALNILYGGQTYFMKWDPTKNIFYRNIPEGYLPTLEIISGLGGSVTVDVELR
ncbi:MAG: hypothetical protein KJ804_07540 [Proteobacteria bacterium]|nr:hypothetical protein [Pseudomonadota bacterium]MBU1058153.1 hypothetical protein [Pseudomonadota bacterium]